MNQSIKIFLIILGVIIIELGAGPLMHDAAYKGDLKKVKESFLMDPTFVNKKDSDFGWTPLFYACQKGHLEIAQFLIEKGADVNAKAPDGLMPIHEAARKGNLEIVMLLVDNGAEVNAKSWLGWTPLHHASFSGNLQLAQYLLSKGADREIVTTQENEKPLNVAIRENNWEIAYLLSDGKIIVSYKTYKGYTPLHQASWYGHLESVKFLIAKGVDLNAKDNENWTPLFVASYKCNLEIVKLLIEKGADIKAEEITGNTPLHIASSTGCLEIIRYLLDKGANKEAKNSQGKTPLDYAKENKQETGIAILTGLQTGNKKTKSENIPNSQLKDNTLILGEVIKVNGNLIDLKFTEKVFKLGDVLYVIQNGEPIGKIVVTQIFPAKITAKIINTSMTISKGMFFGKLNEESKISKKEANANSGNWSEYLGEMDWSNAKTKCASIGMRLPTNDELKAAYTKGVTDSWKKDGSDYLSNASYDDNRVYVLSIESGNFNTYSRDGNFGVRCFY